MLVASATEPTGPRRSIVFAYVRNRCRLFCHRMDAYALFTISIYEDEILDADRRNRVLCSLSTRKILRSCLDFGGNIQKKKNN